MVWPSTSDFVPGSDRLALSESNKGPGETAPRHSGTFFQSAPVTIRTIAVFRRMSLMGQSRRFVPIVDESAEAQ